MSMTDFVQAIAVAGPFDLNGEKIMITVAAVAGDNTPFDIRVRGHQKGNVLHIEIRPGVSDVINL